MNNSYLTKRKPLAEERKMKIALVLKREWVIVRDVNYKVFREVYERRRVRSWQKNIVKETRKKNWTRVERKIRNERRRCEWQKVRIVRISRYVMHIQVNDNGRVWSSRDADVSRWICRRKNADVRVFQIHWVKWRERPWLMHNVHTIKRRASRLFPARRRNARYKRDYAEACPFYPRNFLFSLLCHLIKLLRLNGNFTAAEGGLQFTSLYLRKHRLHRSLSIIEYNQLLGRRFVKLTGNFSSPEIRNDDVEDREQLKTNFEVVSREFSHVNFRNVMLRVRRKLRIRVMEFDAMLKNLEKFVLYIRSGRYRIRKKNMVSLFVEME